MWGCFQEEPKKSGFLLSDLGPIWSLFEGGNGKLTGIDPWTKLSCLPVMARRRGEMLDEMVSILYCECWM